MLSDVINQGLNNPECSFFVGSFIGQYGAIYWLVIMLVIFGLFKVIDKLALEPFLNYLKGKMFKKK